MADDAGNFVAQFGDALAGGSAGCNGEKESSVVSGHGCGVLRESLDVDNIGRLEEAEMHGVFRKSLDGDNSGKPREPRELRCRVRFASRSVAQAQQWQSLDGDISGMLGETEVHGVFHESLGCGNRNRPKEPKLRGEIRESSDGDVVGRLTNASFDNGTSDRSKRGSVVRDASDCTEEFSPLSEVSHTINVCAPSRPVCASVGVCGACVVSSCGASCLVCSGPAVVNERHDACMEGALQGQMKSSARAPMHMTIHGNSSIQEHMDDRDYPCARLTACIRNLRLERSQEVGQGTKPLSTAGSGAPS